MSVKSQSRFWSCVAIAFYLALQGPVSAREPGRITYQPSATSQPGVVVRQGMVVTQEALSAEVGLAILKRGGNAVDAAVATGFAMAVTYPRAGNIGGGGFMVLHLAGRNESIAIDYRETAPAASTLDMFLGKEGKPDATLSRDSALSIGVPGTVAGLALAHARYGSGKFTLADLLQPAIALARDGFIIADDTADTIAEFDARMERWPASRKIFARPDGTSLQNGDRLIQPDLARTLALIAEHGAKGFYEGETAAKLAKAIQDAGGIITTDDLKAYQAIERKPVVGSYRGHDIVAMPLPSSGGLVLIETLNILEGYKLAEIPRGTAPSLHLLIEAMKRSYADRARYLGDPAFSTAPVERLLSKDYAADQRRTIDRTRATPSDDIFNGKASREGQNTTHYSIVDSAGNAVSNTYTLNFSYGLGFVAEGTGVLLNNEMDDFTAAPGASNAFGLVGYEANLPAPGKRPLSSMTPTIVLKDGKVVLVTGSPGGSRIISAVLQVIVNAIDYSLPIDQAVAAPRVHHQWRPKTLFLEQGFDKAETDRLTAMHHDSVRHLGQTSANSIAVTPNGIVGGADPRTRGATAAGY